MKNIKVISITSLMTVIIIALIYTLLHSPFFFVPTDVYRKHGTSSIGNVIRIDDEYTINKTNAVTLSLYYKSGTASAMPNIVEHVNQVNLDKIILLLNRFLIIFTVFLIKNNDTIA
ncbi:hypothetical protein [Carnobacterium divergens]|uniref:hypothetical protein n=1 Tax=Carnobacterium divergens TaxID=2748 RepID=UPI00288E0288|nr:hypothetical protein [Carnobacterium divergens]MDT2012500.1 hypothetical protein [Carnobacterium divergens]